MIRRWYVEAATAAFLLSLSSHVSAQDAALAESLFKAGQEAIASGDWATGCAKFRGSMQAEAAASTQLNLAKCDLHDGKLATAWAQYQRALVLNRETTGAQRKKDLEQYAKKAIEDLEPRLPKVVLTVTPKPTGLTISRDDGVSIPVDALDTPLPVDPGPHKLSFSAPGFVTETRDITAAEAQTARLSVELHPGAPAPTVTATAAPTVAPTAPPPTTSDVAAPKWPWVVGGAGVLMIGAGIVFALDGSSAVSSIHSDCPDVAGTPTCDPKAHDQAFVDGLNSRKNRDLPLAIGFEAVGAAAVGAAVIGLILAPSSKKSATGLSVDVGPRGALVRGSF
jgi:hypothetical protein